MHLQPGTTLQSGKYKILSVIGEGGFGITDLAIHEFLDKKVAIKEFFFSEHCERDDNTSNVRLGTQSNGKTVEQFLTKFIKEAKTIAKFDHPNIIKIHDIFRENNTAYYVMDYIEGSSLSDMVKRGPLPQQQAINYITSVS